MNIQINGKEYKLDFTFNSFRYMEDFSLSEMAELETKPFKIIGISKQLLNGALNNDPKVTFTNKQVDILLEKFVEEGSLSDLLEQLMELLQASNFFKSLQKKTDKK